MFYLFIVLLVIAIIFLASFIIAVFPAFSPIPYFPTNSKDLALIIKTLGLQKGDVLYDLGAGDGMVIMKAAHIPKVQVVGIEIHPLLVFVMYLRRLFHSHRQAVHVVWGDIFKANLSTATVLYLYVGPFVMKRLMQKILSQKPKKLKRIVSYMYNFQLPKNSPYRVKCIHGHRTIYTINL